MKRILATAAMAGIIATATLAANTINWGTGFDSFRDTCAAIGGELNGNGHGSTCAYDGDVVNVPAASNGWTVDVAYGSVATWLGGSNVTEEHSGGVVVACYNPGGQPMKLSHRHCVPR